MRHVFTFLFQTTRTSLRFNGSIWYHRCCATTTHVARTHGSNTQALRSVRGRRAAHGPRPLYHHYQRGIEGRRRERRYEEETSFFDVPYIISGFDGIFDTAEELTTVQAFLSKYPFYLFISFLFSPLSSPLFTCEVILIYNKNEKYLTESQTSEIIMRIQINIQVVAKWG